VLVEGSNGQQVCAKLLLGTLCWALLRLVAAAAAAATACCRVLLLLPLLLSVCNMVLVQDYCVGSQQLQQQLRDCGISQQLTARSLSFDISVATLNVADKLKQELPYVALHLDKRLVGPHTITSVPAAAAAAGGAAAGAAGIVQW
jgi:hypothetical protein